MSTIREIVRWHLLPGPRSYKYLKISFLFILFFLVYQSKYKTSNTSMRYTHRIQNVTDQTIPARFNLMKSLQTNTVTADDNRIRIQIIITVFFSPPSLINSLSNNFLSKFRMNVLFSFRLCPARLIHVMKRVFFFLRLQ